MGLNISSGFNTAKVIYIVVPILIIPQLLFSGVIVKFDKLHPVFSKSTDVPWVGNLMVSRWSYEALAVVQCTENPLEKEYFDINCIKYNAAWKKDFWIPEMQRNLDLANTMFQNPRIKKDAKLVLINEIEKEEQNWQNFSCDSCVEQLKSSKGALSEKLTFEIDNFLNTLKEQYTSDFNEQNDLIEKKKRTYGLKNYTEMRNRFVNEALLDIVTNHLEADKILVYDHKIYRKDNPIYYSAKESSFLNSHFYAPEKRFFGTPVKTFWANIFVLWFFVIISFIALYFDWLRKILENIEYWKNRILKKPLNE